MRSDSTQHWSTVRRLTVLRKLTDAHRTYLRMSALQGAEDGRQVWPAEVRDGPQAGEQRAAADLLEVTLTDVLQHRNVHTADVLEPSPVRGLPRL